MMMSAKPLKMPPIERLVAGQEAEFVRVIRLEAEGWSSLDEEFVIRVWRDYAEKIVLAFDWEDHEERKATLQDRLSSAIVEGQLIREMYLGKETGE